MRRTYARDLQPGARYFGRRDWHLTVERVERHGVNRVEVHSLNSFGEPIVERYPHNTMIELIEVTA